MGGSGSEGDFGSDFSEEEDAPDEEGVRHLEEEPWNGISDDGGDDDIDMEDPTDDDDDDEQPSSTRSPSASPPPQLVPVVSPPSSAESAPASAPTPGKYVPPALRARIAAEAAAAAGGTSEADLKKMEEMLKLEKTVNGLLNRLGESNIEAILGDLEGVYRKYPRNGASSLDPYALGPVAEPAVSLLQTSPLPSRTSSSALSRRTQTCSDPSSCSTLRSSPASTRSWASNSVRRSPDLGKLTTRPC